MTDLITLPRAVVEQLVDPKGFEYCDDMYGSCNFCSADCTQDKPVHEPTCPVRLAQEALRQPQETPL